MSKAMVKLRGGPFDGAEDVPVSDPKGHILCGSEDKLKVPEGHMARYEYKGTEGEMEYVYLIPTLTVPLT